MIHVLTAIQQTLFLTGIHSNPATSSISTSLDDIVRDSLQLESNYYQNAPTAATVASSLPDQRTTTRNPSNSPDPSKSVPTDRPRLGEFSYNEEDLSQVDKDLIFEGLKQLYYKKVLVAHLSPLSLSVRAQIMYLLSIIRLGAATGGGFQVRTLCVTTHGT